MSAVFRPMLATDAELNKLRFPLYASAKLDGVRATVRDGVVYSRSNKPIPNKHVQKKFGAYEYFDGELIVGEPTSKTVYRDTVSGVMSVEGEPDVSFFVFDHIFKTHERYEARRPTSSRYNLKGGVVAHQQLLCKTLEEVLAYEEKMLDLGYEGLILRCPDAPYKMGRSTVNEGYLLKLKRFEDAEATVIGYDERMHNGNAATTNELGRTARSSHKSGKSGRGDLGALLLRTPDDVEFSCGTGFSDDERASLWADREQLIGRIAKYKFFPVGVKCAPRHPVFLGFRDKRDL